MCVLSQHALAPLLRRSSVFLSLGNRHITAKFFSAFPEPLNPSILSTSYSNGLLQLDSRLNSQRSSFHNSVLPRLPSLAFPSGGRRDFDRRDLCQKARGREFVDEDMAEPVRRRFQVVVAATTENNGIGKDGKLPWSLPSDVKFFKKVTAETASAQKMNAVVMGRNTWQSLPPRFRPLPGRLNVVLSRTKAAEDLDGRPGENVVVGKSLNHALEMLAEPEFADAVENVYVIGGNQVFGEAMTSPFCDAIHWTEIEGTFECDVFCPAVDRSLFSVWASTTPTMEGPEVRCSFVTYVRRSPCKQRHPAVMNGGVNEVDKLEGKPYSSVNSSLPKFISLRHEEYQYLDLIRDIIDNGNVKMDRTGTGTRSKFGCQMRFNLRKTFPLLTTKRVHWRGIVEELLWFISGSTNAKVLQDKDIHIWDGNSTKEYLSSLGLGERGEGDLGPIYGFQWRHFGAKYINMHTDYSGQGFDQLADVIRKIRTNPDDRRIMLSAWNPADLNLMALPPCHMFAQFYVANGEVSCQMYQRSCDMGLGVPYNIASYSLLTYMIAHVCDLVPGDFVHVLGDAHVYNNHIDPLQLQLENSPKPFPTLKIRNSASKDIDSLTANDFELKDYECSKRINMKLAI